MRGSNRGSQALIGAGLLGLALARTALGAGAETPKAADAAEELSEVVVTGSRIAASIGMETPTPVTAITAEELQTLSPSTLISALSQLPQFYANTNSDVRTGFFSSPGEGNLNLRGLNTGGSGRTLTLLDGRRVVPANGFGSVDINILPSTLLKRVDTVTGGASAAYGTDAVAGAVNFILDTRYNGWKLNAQLGDTSRSDRGNMEYSAAWGTPLGEHMHLLASAEYYKADRVDSYTDRGWYNGYALIANPAATTATTAAYYQPTYIPRTNVVSSVATEGGLICGSSATVNPAPCNIPTTSALYRRYFLPDGTLAPFALGEGTSPAVAGQSYGAHSIAASGSGDDTTADLLDLAPKASRGSAFVYLDYDVTPSLNLYVQGLAGQSTIDQRDHGGRFAAVNGIDSRITIFRENPYLPAAVRQIMVNENLTSFVMNLVGGRADLGRESRLKQDNKTVSGTAGFKWELAQAGPLAGWQVNGYGQYGTADNKGYQQGLVIDHFLAAVDAIPDPANPANTICRAATINPTRYGDCVPINLFGTGNASDAAINYVTRFTAGQQITSPLFFQPDEYQSGKTVSFTSGYGKVYNTTTKQTVGDLSANGKVFEGWAGPIAAALGVSYRKEEIEQIVYDPSNPASDPSILPASTALNPALRGVPTYFATRSSMVQNSTVANVHGSYDVKEAFTEWQVPLLSGMPGAEQLNLLASARIADYRGSGSVWSWKTGLDWQVLSDLRLRGTVSRDLRAATLLERFNQTGGAGSVTDRFWVVGTTAQVHAVSTRTGGNPGLDPETSKTHTYGFVYEPSALQGLSASLDYWNVDISGAIGTLGTQRIVDDCFGSGGTGAVCSLITFDTDGHVSQVRNITQNIAAAKGRGLDIEVGYRRPISLFRDGGEHLGLRLFWSHLMENSTLSDRSNPALRLDLAGQVGAGALPEEAVTATLNYTAGPFNLALSARYIGDGTISNSFNLPGRRPDVADNTIGSVTYFNLEGGYSWELSSGKLELYANVQNLLDRDPPAIPTLFDSTLGQTGNGGTNSGLYDLLGRRFTLGVQIPALMPAASTGLRTMAVVASLLTTACAGTGNRATADQLYPVAAALDATLLLPPPPTAELALRRDLEAVRAAQHARTPAQAAEAEASSTVDPFLFAAVLGPRFTPEQVPETARFLRLAYRSALPYLQATKDCWNRPRPFVVDPTLTPLEQSLASTKLRSAPAPAPRAAPAPPAVSPCTAPVADATYAPSYPSGHAAVGALLAIVLAELVPEQRAALFAFGWEYGNARVISGVHFPSDVEAGRILGSVLVEMMQQDARFRSDLRAARGELRKVLGY